MYMKYIIVKDHGRELPYIFPALLNHDDVVAALGSPAVASAGIVMFTEQGLRCSGESMTLGIRSRKGEDSTIINEMLGVKLVHLQKF